jgi:hypothetical protein
MIQQSRPYLGLGFMGLNPLRIIIRPQEKQIKKILFLKENIMAKRPIITQMKFLKYESLSINEYL